MPFAAASSEHPLATHAVGEVVGAVLEGLGDRIDVAFLFVGAPFAGALADMAGVVGELLDPACLIGAASGSLVADGALLERRAGVTLLAASWGGRMRIGGRGLRTVRIEAERIADGWSLHGDDAIDDDGATLVLLNDATTFPTEGFLDEIHRRTPSLTVVGGTVSTLPDATAASLLVDGEVVRSGAVGLLLPAGSPVSTVLSQGAKAFGPVLAATAAGGSMIREIAGRPALDVLMGILSEADPDTRRAANQNLGVGLLIKETGDDPSPEDFVVRRIWGADRSAGAIAIEGDITAGTLLRFAVRDPSSATSDLGRLLDGRDPAAAVVFASQHRDRSFFSGATDDAAVVTRQVRGGVASGLATANEIGTVAGRPLLHSMATSVLLLDG